jgi:putative flippase GtrA
VLAPPCCLKRHSPVGIAGFVMSSAVLITAAMFVSILATKLVAIAVSFAVNFSLSLYVMSRPRPNEETSR